MDFGFDEAQQRFRGEVVEFLEREVTPELVTEVELGLGWGHECRQFLRKLGAKGWLTVTWPREYGGLEASNVERLIIMDELTYYGIRLTMVGAGIAGPVIMMYGSDEQKKEFLPGIAQGDIEFALGYTEPEAGSDLAALEIRAVQDGDYYVMNGQKIFNTACHYAQYHWLAARTDPDAPRHRGISLFIVPLDLSGITIEPLWCMDGYRTNAVFYDDVRVPRKNLVGQENRGFYQIADALTFERMVPTGHLRRTFTQLLRYLAEAKRDGRRLRDDIIIRRRLAQMATEIEIGRLLSYHVASLVDQGIVPTYQASMVKLWVSELAQRLGDLGMQIFGPYRQLSPGSKWMQHHGAIQRAHFRAFRDKIVGGTSEIQRNIIATRGLGLPRS